MPRAPASLNHVACPRCVANKKGAAHCLGLGHHGNGAISVPPRKGRRPAAGGAPAQGAAGGAVDAAVNINAAFTNVHTAFYQGGFQSAEAALKKEIDEILTKKANEFEAERVAKEKEFRALEAEFLVKHEVQLKAEREVIALNEKLRVQDGEYLTVNGQLQDCQGDRDRALQLLQESRDRFQEGLLGIKVCSVCREQMPFSKKLCCPNFHYMCEECTTNAVIVSKNGGYTYDALKCNRCQESSTTDNLSHVIDAKLYAEYVAGRAILAAARDARASNPNEEVISEDAINFLYTPCCNKKADNFDSCCAVICPKCKLYFCAYCLGGFDGGMKQGSKEMHDHVASCPNNPGGDRYFASSRGQKVAVRHAIMEFNIATAQQARHHDGSLACLNIPFNEASAFPHPPSPPRRFPAAEPDEAAV